MNVGARSADSISEADFVGAYRLLLGRDPDPGSLTAVRELLRLRKMTTRELVSNMISSEEFQSRFGLNAAKSAQPVLTKQNGFDIFVLPGDSDIGEVIRSREYEPHVAAAFREILKPGMNVLDVGANIGFFTMLAASITGPGGLVISVEPLDKNVQLLQKSALHNGFAHVQVFPVAAAETSRTVAMTTHARTSNGETLGHAREGDLVFAPGHDLDKLLLGIDRLHLMKIDIEGFELLAWRGLQKTLARLRPIVISEFHPMALERCGGCNAEEYAGELLKYAGRIQVLQRGGSRKTCMTVNEVMTTWKDCNTAAGLNGRMHLDLLADPGHA